MRSTPEPVDPLLTRPLGGVPASRPADASQAASGSTPRRISESVYELDGKWFTKVPLPGREHAERSARRVRPGGLAAEEHSSDAGHRGAALGRQLSRAISDAGGQVVIVDTGRTAAQLQQAEQVALVGS